MNGYVRIYRKIVDWEWYTDVNTKSLFLHLILLANHDDRKWRGETVKRGELVTSYGNLASQTGLTFQQVRTCLKRLQSTNDITIKTTNRNTLIMVVKYDFYQSDEQTEIERINKQNNNQITNNQQSNNNQITTNKNDKNDKNDKKNIYSPVPDDMGLLIPESEAIPYKEIIHCLNKFAKTKYKHTGQVTKDKIKARWNDGFRLNDFETVIKNKCSEWVGTEMEKYLRPKTLFGSNFESYLNQKVSNEKPNSENIPDWYKNTGETKPDDELLKQVEEMKRGINRET